MVSYSDLRESLRAFQHHTLERFPIAGIAETVPMLQEMEEEEEEEEKEEERETDKETENSSNE